MNILFIIKILLIVVALIVAIFPVASVPGLPIIFLCIAMLIDVIQERA